MGCCKKRRMLNNQRVFVDPHRPDDVYKLKRVLYGLKQALKAWYDRLTAYLIEHGFKKGFADTTLFIRKDKNYFVIAQIYVDDIVFGSTNDSLAQYFVDEMKKMFEMSMVGELTYFLGLQVKQTDLEFKSTKQSMLEILSRDLDLKRLHMLEHQWLLMQS